MDHYSMAAKTIRVTLLSTERLEPQYADEDRLHEASGRPQFTNPADADRVCNVFPRRAKTKQI